MGAEGLLVAGDRGVEHQPAANGHVPTLVAVQAAGDRPRGPHRAPQVLDDLVEQRQRRRLRGAQRAAQQHRAPQPADAGLVDEPVQAHAGPCRAAVGGQYQTRVTGGHPVVGREQDVEGGAAALTRDDRDGGRGGALEPAQCPLPPVDLLDADQSGKRVDRRSGQFEHADRAGLGVEPVGEADHLGDQLGGERPAPLAAQPQRGGGGVGEGHRRSPSFSERPLTIGRAPFRSSSRGPSSSAPRNPPAARPLPRTTAGRRRGTTRWRGCRSLAARWWCGAARAGRARG